MSLVLTVLLTVSPHHAMRNDKCRYQSLDHHAGFSTLEVKRTIECASHHFGVDTSTALAIARRESGPSLDPYAVNRSSGACGIFQHMPAYFRERLARVPRHFYHWVWDCLNARSNVLAALWLARQGWSPWGGAP